MIAAGWVEECRTLMNREPPLSREASQALGYRTLFAHLRGELTLAEAAELICRDTRHFARRQLSWFRRFTDAVRIPIAGEELKTLEQKPEESEKIVAAWADRVSAAWNRSE
jgi:tRNA dimethylallyltransferase